MGQRRLRDRTLLQQFTSTLFTIGKHLNDMQPVGISESLAYRGYVNRIFLHFHIHRHLYDEAYPMHRRTSICF